MIDTEVKWPDELERMAREAEPAALAVADEKFAEYAAEHERQTAGFRFECRRWGDFLSIFMERQANEAEWRGALPVRKIATALNIGNAKGISFFDGHCFDRRGTLSYSASSVSDDGRCTSWGTGGGHRAPPKGWHYEVNPRYPHVPKSREMVVLDPMPTQDRTSFSPHHLSDDSYEVRHTTPFPRPAEDDRIRFEGIGATIYAPAGMGRAVYDAIMAEIERGYEPAQVGRYPNGRKLNED